MEIAELDRESAELLPDRQALCCWHYSWHPWNGCQSWNGWNGGQGWNSGQGWQSCQGWQGWNSWS